MLADASALRCNVGPSVNLPKSTEAQKQEKKITVKAA
jgi:hypothetical protein